MRVISRLGMPSRAIFNIDEDGSETADELRISFPAVNQVLEHLQQVPLTSFIFLLPHTI